MLDLYTQKYDRDTLKRNIYSVNLWDVVKTQVLDASFIVRYILNPTYQLTKEEETMELDQILRYQPHLERNEIEKEQATYDSDDDSIDTFDTYLPR